ncbi:hypothetical protein SLEP1_g38986 [Rubroshorea leprosula]|uniref:Uncharacterized protein n=1 Tax=Rubroshorea leprosula TaxID=152421 RepID=A0AAV5KZI5_9ROSI|nr:hypothetical protein SLEP1_g38986 [Rubroshorea leprosula]
MSDVKIPVNIILSSKSLMAIGQHAWSLSDVCEIKDDLAATISREQ